MKTKEHFWTVMDRAKAWWSWCAQWCDTLVPVERMGSNRSSNLSSTTPISCLLSEDIEQFLVDLRIPDNWWIWYNFTYPTWKSLCSLPLTDENLRSSATFPRYSIDAYMNCVDACYQTLKHKMNGRCCPASNLCSCGFWIHYFLGLLLICVEAKS